MVRIAICFFGEMGFMDKFMIQNFIRCVITPIKRYDGDVEFCYFLHTFLHADVFSFIELMRASFSFMTMTLHDDKMVFLKNKQHDGVKKKVFLEDYSLHYVKKMWKHNTDGFDVIVCTRLDLLFTRPLTDSDANLIFKNKQQHLFIGGDQTLTDLHRGFILGDPLVMSIYTDNQHHSFDISCIELMRSQYNIKIHPISVVFVRILPEAIVSPMDYKVCPYLDDLISSSSTKIRLVKRKPPKLKVI